MLTRRIPQSSKLIPRSSQCITSQLTKNFTTAGGAHEGYVPPDLTGLENRWPKMSEFDQTDLIEHLQERQTLPWSQLTIPEKRALYYIYYGAWGPRSKIPVESLAATVLKRLAVIVAVLGLGIASYNWAKDFEEGQRVQDVIDKVTQLKIEEQKKKKKQEEENLKIGEEAKGKRWWFF